MRKILAAALSLLLLVTPAWADSLIPNLPAAGASSGSDQFPVSQSGGNAAAQTLSVVFATPPAIGGTTPAAGAFTTLSATGAGTFAGASFSGGLTFSGLSNGTQVSCLGLSASNSVVLLNSACGTPGVTSITGTSGQVTASASTGAVTLSLPSTLTQNTTYSGTATFSNTVSGTGITNLFGSPPAIGGTSAAGGAFTTLSASSTVSGSGFSTYLASPPAIGGISAAAGTFTNLTATGTTTLGVTGSTQCLHVNGSGVVSGVGFDCGSGGGGSLTVNDTASHSVTSTTTIDLSQGLALTGNGSGTATFITYAPDRPVSTGTATPATGDLGGLITVTSANSTNTASSPSNTVFTQAGETVVLSNQAATVLTITNPNFTVAGVALSTKIHQNGWMLDTFNGASIDAIGYPGADTITASAVPIFTSDGSGALTASEISDASAGGVTVGSPTGGQKGAGTINATGLFVNGNAVSTGGTVTSIATTSPITGGTITTTGTIACATCVTSAASLTNNALMLGAGSQGSQTDATITASAGSLTLSPAGTASSLIMGNATSGQVTLQTVTGALGTVTASLPANTGTIAELNLKQSWTAAQRGTPTNISISTATFTPNFDTAQNFEIDLVHASCPCTLANPSTTLVAGQSGMIEVHQSATGSDTIGTWGSDYQYAGGTASISLSTAASAVDYLPYYVNNAATGIVLGGIIKGPAH